MRAAATGRRKDRNGWSKGPLVLAIGRGIEPEGTPDGGRGERGCAEENPCPAL